MTKNLKHTGKAKSIPCGMAISAVISIGMTILCSGAIAYFLDTEKMTWETAGYWIMFLLLGASFIGGKSAITAVKRQRMLISLMSGVVYWGVLLCITALFFGGKYEGVWVTAGLIAAGCAIAGMLTMPEKQKQGKKARRGYR